MLKHLFTALLCLLPTLGIAQDKSRAILVLDASGSMWGQIDGKAKITIAQDVIGDLLQSLPANQELGLTVYGHRRKGDCSDIETMILPGGDTRNAIMMAVSAITPKGKTPLSAAVIQAAEALKYTEERATVILVSDGRETCELDPCEVGRNLEKAGIDFTAHVIGFDISSAKDRAELQCLAEETGGTFRTASNAAELNDALQVIAEPDPVKVTFRAIEGKDGPVIETPLVWWLGYEDKTLIDNTPHDNNFSMEMLAGSGRVEVMRPEDEANVQAEFTVDTDSMTVTLVLPELLPAASLTAPDTAVAGSNIAIGWDGPNGKNDHITVAEISTSGMKSIGYSYMKDGNPTSLKMPLHPGEYQLRYVMGLGSKILARRKIIITPVTATLSPPTPITAGSIFALEWTGPDYKNDHITLAKPGTKVSTSETYAYTKNGNPMQLMAPTTPGTYLLRYIGAGPDQMAIASMEVEVVAVSATLESKDTVPAGSELAVTWTGPDSKNDYIAINEVGDDLSGELSYTYTQHSTGDSLNLQTPTTPGTYELRYIQNGRPKVMLASKIITVAPVTATLQSDDTLPAGGEIMVTWTGPNDKNDYIAINEIGDDLGGELSYAYLRNSTGDKIALKLPTTVGTYELRYIHNGKPKAMLTSKIITVVPVTATLQSKDTAPAGSKIEVTWTGPDSKNDYIAINEVGDDLSGELAYFYTQNSTGNKITLDLPTKAGTYELRYIQNGKPKVMLASKIITLVPVSATIETTDTVPAGGKLQVTWSGPNDKRDYIALAEVGSDVNDELVYEYLERSQGQILTMDMPNTTGTYELRYIQNGKPRAMLASRPLTITAVEASVASDDTVPAGGRLMVTWSGPNGARDYIALAEVGSPVKKELAYEYVERSDGQNLALVMPTVTGQFELRYIQNGNPKTILAMKPVTIQAVTASLEADTTAPSGGKLLVKWTGPNNDRDYISIANIGSKVADEVTYAYLRDGDGQAIFLDVPGVPGTYEMRYIQNGSPKVILTTRPLTVETVGATLTAKATVAPGANLVVEWSGPNYKNDRIAISRVGDKGLATYAYTRDGSPLIVKAPDGVGDFELLYVMGQDGHVLVRQPLQIQ